MRYDHLRDDANDGNKAAKRKLNNILGKHAASLLDQTNFAPSVLATATDIYIVDPLHSLELNVAKVERFQVLVLRQDM
eukprot:6176909-Pleurochrysis_carterae.AAC.1